MRKRLSCILGLMAMLSLIPHTAGAQVAEEWVARYRFPGSQTNRAVGLVGDDAGNVAVTGNTYSIGSSYDIVTVKYNSAGQELWASQFAGADSLDDIAVAVIRDPEGNIIVTGWSYLTFNNCDIITIKYDMDGIEQWTAHYSGAANFADLPYALTVDSSGNVYVVGETFETVPYKDMVVIKYNAQGDEQWVRTRNGTGNYNDWACAVEVDADHNVYVTGTALNTGTSYDYITLKYDSTGTEQWATPYNGTSNSSDTPFDLAVDGAGHVYVTGSSLGVGTYYDIATIRYNLSGQEEWVQRYNGPDSSGDEGFALITDAFNSVYVAGYCFGGPTFEDFLTIKYNSSGAQQWLSTYSQYPDNDEAHALALDAQGNVFVTGWSEGQATSEDFTTLKYDPQGNQLWVIHYNGPAGTDDRAADIVVDAAGIAYVTGFGTDISGITDITTIKYVPATAVEFPPQNHPFSFILHPCHPNPFNASTVINFELRVPSLVTLEVFDINGRCVRVQNFEPLQVGTHQITFDGSDLPSGLYFAKLTAGDFSQVQKLVLLK